MVYRVFVEKKPAQANEAKALLNELQALLGLSMISGLRLFYRWPNVHFDLGNYHEDASLM